MIITQTFTTARWQIVVKKSEATKQTKDQNNNKTKNKNKKQKHKTTAQNTKTGRGILSYRYYFIDFLERFIWILFYIFYFTDFILHDSPKSQLTFEFSGLAYPLLNAVHLFHSCLSLWSPTNVLFFPLFSPQWRHLSPTTPILYVHGRCGPFIH